VAELRHKKGVWALSQHLLSWLAKVSGLVLFAIVLLITVSVFCRYMLNQPILGSQELVQLGMVLVVMLAMPYTTIRNEHIRVDILDKALGPNGRYIGDLISRALSSVVLSLLAWKSSLKALDALEYEETTNMLELPVWPVYAAIALSMSLYALVLFIELVQQLTSWGKYDD